MAEYIYGNPNKTHSWENVASIFAAHDSLHSAQTSSLPLVQFWKPSGKLLNNKALKLLGQCFGTEGLEEEFGNAELFFEYPVPVGKGRGKASMTDLMIITDKHAIAVEAKWTECKEPYEPTIKDWLDENQETKDNRENVLNSWIEYINRYFEKQDSSIGEIDADKIADTAIPYQLLHRIASACASACPMADKTEGKEERTKVAAVIYQLFYSDESLQNSAGGKNSTLEVAKGFAEKYLQKGYDTLFKDINHPVPIQFCIIMTKVAKGDNYDTAMQKCKMGQKPQDLNKLFLEMQKNGGIYKFPEDSKPFPKRRENHEACSQ